MKAVGLYDPAYEHDACGVAFVARLDGVASHETRRARGDRAREPRASRRRGRRRRHRRRRGHDAAAPGRALSRRARRCASAAGRYGVAVCFLPRDAARAAELERAARPRPSRPRGSASSPGATSRSTSATPARRPPRLPRGSGSSSSRPRRGSTADAFERKLYVIRRVAELAAGPDLVIPSFSSRTIVYKGMLTAPQLTAYYPDLQRRAHRLGARARPLALLDEHLPELGARAPVPDDRPQRRDQHAARQRQLDARARVAARVRALRRRPREGPAGRPARRLRLGDVRQRARAARARGPVAAARDHDDDPGGVPGPRRHLARARGVLRLPPVPDGGLGRPGGDRVHRRPRDRRDARPQRPAPGPLARDAGRLGRPRVGDGRARGAAGEHRAQGAAAAREALPRRRRAGPDRPGRGGQADGRVAAARTPSGTGARSCGSTTCRRGPACEPPPSRCAGASSRSATRRRT